MSRIEKSLDVARPSWLIASGDSDRIEVQRSPLVREDDSIYEPVRRFVAEHGLALATRETFEDDAWMFGSVEVSVYTADRQPDSLTEKMLDQAQAYRRVEPGE